MQAIRCEATEGVDVTAGGQITRCQKSILQRYCSGNSKEQYLCYLSFMLCDVM